MSSQITLRDCMPEDKEALFAVEAASMPHWRYLPAVFELFMSDERGAFFLAEHDGVIAACAKFTVLANETAWLETLRVDPKFQGLGIGKQLYKHFFKLAKHENINTMRMYTGLNNAISKGLAEFSGFDLEETFYGYSLAHEAISNTQEVSSFKLLKDEARAAQLVMNYKDRFAGFVVMNRTFYSLTPELCAYFARQDMVYEDASSDSVMIMGARFMPERSLHLAFFAGNDAKCIAFAKQKALELAVGQMNCLFAVSSKSLERVLLEAGFQADAAPYIVMRVDL